MQQLLEAGLSTLKKPGCFIKTAQTSTEVLDWKEEGVKHWCPWCTIRKSICWGQGRTDPIEAAVQQRRSGFWHRVQIYHLSELRSFHAQSHADTNIWIRRITLTNFVHFFDSGDASRGWCKNVLSVMFPLFWRPNSAGAQRSNVSTVNLIPMESFFLGHSLSTSAIK